MARPLVITWMAIVALSICCCGQAEEKEAGPVPSPIKVKMKGPRGNPKLAGLKRFASQEEIDKAFGEGEVTLGREVDFAKEDVLCIGRIANPPSGKLQWESTAEDGIKFFVQERPSKVRSNVVMVIDEWFTVPKGTKAVFGK